MKIIFEKRKLFALLVAKINSKLGFIGTQYAMSETDYKWFETNIDFVAYGIENIISVITSMPVDYTETQIVYEISPKHPLQNRNIAEIIQRYLIEKVSEMYIDDKAINLPIPQKSKELYAQLKSLTLKYTNKKLR